jgi:hypothetical protein
MAEVRKVLGQYDMPATTEEVIYTATAVQAVVSSIVVCNRNATGITFRVSISVGGGATNPKDYLYYDVACPANDTFIATVGFTMGAGDVIRAYTSSASVSVSAFGVEIS